MRRFSFLTFVLVCSLILCLSSCGSVFSGKTGAIAITLPGASSNRDVYKPNEGDLQNAQYEIVIYQETEGTEPIEKTGTGGETLIVNGLEPGDYLISITAHVHNGYYVGGTKNAVSVVAGQTATALISLTQRQRFEYIQTDDGINFQIARQPEDDQYADCFLIGPEGIMIKPNLDGTDLNNEFWAGIWPFKPETGSKEITFYLGGSWGGQWHDQSQYNNQVPCNVNEIDQNTGTLSLPSAESLQYFGDKQDDQGNRIYETYCPTVSNDGLMKWTGINGHDSFDIPGDKWCKIEIWSGKDTGNGTFVSGSHFKCNDPDNQGKGRYQTLLSSGLTFDDLELYDGMTSDALKTMLVTNSEYQGNWFVRCSLFFKPDGDDSFYQIEFPSVSSESKQFTNGN